MNNKAVANLKYIVSYLIAFPISLFMFIGFSGLNIDILTSLQIRNAVFLLCFLLIIEMTLMISSFNYLAYKSSLKNIDKEKSKKIYKKLVLLNLIVMTIVVVGMELNIF